MKRCLLLVLILLSGCQAPKSYWYHPNRTLDQAKWDLVNSAEYTAYGFQAYKRDAHGTDTALACNLRQYGYVKLLTSELPADVSTATVWLHLIPYYIAGIDLDMPKPPSNTNSLLKTATVKSQSHPNTP